ncbi:DUF2442 domain-containing protein [Myxosarcina sp. GI1]|uniref:DUF2442 domain-containing protein n=1 Tax=Myxosarcina sp. GI1 TaxID=1541065 RepID=UPI000560577B|nr:DUF2442 domain-containing protein [Myxosarcina sp. GI1]
MAQLSDQQIEAQIDAAIARSAEIDAVEPRANRVIFDDGKIIIYFNNGATFSFLIESVEAIAALPAETLATVELTPSGKGLRWDEPDIDLSIQGLLLGIFGSNVWMQQIAAKGGQSTSEKKRAASRANGKKGGRPRKVSSK